MKQINNERKYGKNEDNPINKTITLKDIPKC